MRTQTRGDIEVNVDMVFDVVVVRLKIYANFDVVRSARVSSNE